MIDTPRGIPWRKMTEAEEKKYAPYFVDKTDYVYQGMYKCPFCSTKKEHEEKCRKST